MRIVRDSRNVQLLNRLNRVLANIDIFNKTVTIHGRGGYEAAAAIDALLKHYYVKASVFMRGDKMFISRENITAAIVPAVRFGLSDVEMSYFA